MQSTQTPLSYVRAIWDSSAPDALEQVTLHYKNGRKNRLETSNHFSGAMLSDHYVTVKSY